jgi:hypothetical protein
VRRGARNRKQRDARQRGEDEPQQREMSTPVRHVLGKGTRGFFRFG